MIVGVRVTLGKPFWDARNLKSQVEHLAQQIGAEGQRYMAEYPAQRLTQSGYRRTGTLKRSWSYSVTSQASDLVIEISSNGGMAPYGPYVQGPEGTQRVLFRGAGWRNIDDVIEKLHPALLEGIARIIKGGF